MKIGIITYHRPLNFGATLQTVGLSKKINDLGGDVEIIDYRNDFQEKSIKNIKYKTAVGTKNKLKSILFSKVNNEKARKFKKFIESNTVLSKEVYDQTNINNCNNMYDTFISGSDQIWNLNLNGCDYNYFLKFVSDDNKKLSYASSFGYDEVPEEYKTETIKYLKKYKTLTTREIQGKNIIEKLTGKDAIVTLDPTLLLNKEEWLKLAKAPKFELPERYILLYTVSPTKEDFKIARKLSKKMKMQVILINYNMKYVFGMKNCFDLGPEEFLYLFNKATYIITNSFHGTAFSINFNKDFLVRLSTKANNGNSRIKSIIEKMNLEDRYVDLENIKTITHIDWKEVNSRLETERQESINILSTYIK